jgi:hypothetical protein
LAICAILLFTPIGQPGGYSQSCGSVVVPVTDMWGDGTNRTPSGCENARGTRLTISLIVGAAGAAALYGSSQVKKREDD